MKDRHCNNILWKQKLVEFERENGVLREDLERTKDTLVGKETELVEFARKLKSKESYLWWMFGFLAILALAIIHVTPTQRFNFNKVVYAFRYLIKANRSLIIGKFLFDRFGCTKVGI